MNEKTKKILGGLAALAILSFMYPVLVAAPLAFLDAIFGGAATGTPVPMWILGGALVGGIYGSVAAVKKYRLNRKQNLIPIGALVILAIISVLAAL